MLPLAFPPDRLPPLASASCLLGLGREVQAAGLVPDDRRQAMGMKIYM